MLVQNKMAIFICLTIFGSLFLTACSSAQASEAVIEDKWMTSAHAGKESSAFAAWNDADPAEIPENCAKCHSTHGYLDFLGLDGATPGQVDKPAPTGSTIECEVCHNEVTRDKQVSIQPSGAELTGLGRELTCLDCHQGRQSAKSVDEAIGGLADNTVSTKLSFPNIHNNPAGPIQYGTEAKGGYEYEGQTYVGRYEHVLEFETCIACHDAHTLKVDARTCNACHLGVSSPDDFTRIRVSNIDYDGDGDIDEGLAGEIETMRERLLVAIRLYAATTEGLDDIAYEDRRPYFFNSAGEGYATWTPRLLRAAYNYHYATEGSGHYAHNGPYTIQLLYDSLDDLGANIFPMTRPGPN